MRLVQRQVRGERRARPLDYRNLTVTVVAGDWTFQDGAWISAKSSSAVVVAVKFSFIFAICACKKTHAGNTNLAKMYSTLVFAKVGLPNNFP